LFKLNSEELVRLASENHLVPEKKLEEAVRKAADQKISLQGYLVEKKIISERDLVMLYGQANNIPFIDLSAVELQKQLMSRIPEKIAVRYQAVIFGQEEDGSFKLAMTDPLDIEAVQFIEKELGYSSKLYIATASDISNALDIYKEGLSSEISKVIQESAEEISIEEGELKDNTSAGDVQEIVQEAPISKALNIILEYAVKSRASDIHIEPREGFIQVRFRVDGMLQDTMNLPKTVLSSLVTRIKILSNLRIDEHRVPQDGRIKVKVGAKIISIRVSTLPVIDGEKVVMRLLDESNKAPTLEELGFSGTALMGIKRALTQPHGMLLVTGPTGSGKSTTLYSALSMLNAIEVNISTVEDPIEYRMPGVNQTQVNTKTGMTFASGLRALLRQDPDIIMVGEIRDTETAEMAVHAALTGHVVLSTLHTNNAAGCLPRLLDMEVEPFLISSTVNAVIGQRLVRRLCNDCKEAYTVDRVQIEELVAAFNLDRRFLTVSSPREILAEAEKIEKECNIAEKIISSPENLTDNTSMLEQIARDPAILARSLKESEAQDVKTVREALFTKTDQKIANNNQGELRLVLYRSRGCKKCGNTGYTGRLGVYEVLEVSEEIGRMIVGHSSTDDLERAAINNGMITMAQDGFIKSLIGVTTVEEILRVTRE
jgi:type IV pilus assembly protein PilB